MVIDNFSPYNVTPQYLGPFCLSHGVPIVHLLASRQQYNMVLKLLSELSVG
jgi:hypothetical protein